MERLVQHSELATKFTQFVQSETDLLYCANPTIDAHVARLLTPHIGELLCNPTVQDININSGGRVFVDYGDGQERHTGWILAQTNIEAAIRLLLASAGGYLDADAAFASLSLQTGARFHGSLPPVSDEPQISIRTHRRILRPLTDFMRQDQIDFVSQAIQQRKSVMVGGATAAGKTTLVNSLLNLIPPNARLVIIEDTPELQVTHTNVARRIAIGKADLKRHIYESLRCRPDWLCIGETRDHSAFDLIDAARSGHPGISTCHADSADGVLSRLATLANRDIPFVTEGLDVVLHVERFGSKRAVTEIKSKRRDSTWETMK